jgi:glycosyltransferase involved in cell wall biosynthesis
LVEVDLSRWAVVSYKDDTGLGREAQVLRTILGLGYHLVSPSKQIEGLPLEGPNEIPFERDLSLPELKAILSRLEGIIFFESNYWHPQLLSVAKELGLKIVCAPNWEWFDGDDAQWQHCDLFVCYSRFTEKIVTSYGWHKTVVIPAPLDLARFAQRHIAGPARTFIHNAGLVNEDDRKGTRDTILAFKRIARKDISLKVRMQKEVDLPEIDERIQVIVGNLKEPQALYAEGDVAIQPSKMEGIGFMVLEPFCCGMPVITLDYPPMNEYIKTPELLVRKQWFKRNALPSHWIKHAHLRLPDLADLSKKIAWCADNDMTAIALGNRKLAEETFAPEILKTKWFTALSKL